jgi:hypothetical protein
MSVPLSGDGAVCHSSREICHFWSQRWGKGEPTLGFTSSLAVGTFFHSLGFYFIYLFILVDTNAIQLWNSHQAGFGVLHQAPLDFAPGISEFCTLHKKDFAIIIPVRSSPCPGPLVWEVTIAGKWVLVPRDRPDPCCAAQSLTQIWQKKKFHGFLAAVAPGGTWTWQGTKVATAGLLSHSVTSTVTAGSRGLSQHPGTSEPRNPQPYSCLYGALSSPYLLSFFGITIVTVFSIP